MQVFSAVVAHVRRHAYAIERKYKRVSAPLTRCFPCAKRCLGNRAQSSKRSLFTQTPTFAFRSSTPDTELFFVVQRVFETLRPNVALTTDGARCFGRTTTLGEEDLGIDLSAARVRLPLDGLKKLGRDPLHPPVLSFPLDLETAKMSASKSQFCNSKYVIRVAARGRTKVFSRR